MTMDREGEEQRGWRLKESTLKRLQELTAQVTSLHHEIQDLEKQRSYAMSSKTGCGLEPLRRALSVLMKNEVLFLHVWMKVPLNYTTLERLAQEGRGRVDEEAKSERAAWESVVTKHVEAKAIDALRRLCARPYVTLPELETEAGKVDMDRKELTQKGALSRSYTMSMMRSEKWMCAFAGEVVMVELRSIGF